MQFWIFIMFLRFKFCIFFSQFHTLVRTHGISVALYNPHNVYSGEAPARGRASNDVGCHSESLRFRSEKFQRESRRESRE